jgi:hypothetical protein
VHLKKNQIIAIENARKLLGDEGLYLTDEEILMLIEDFDMIAQYTIKMVQEFKNSDDEQINKMIK